ncbi:MAG: thiosulfohydrolase SoxB, partial [Beijerinckiaceae bacterium]
MKLIKSGAAIEAGKEYTVTGWASVNEGTEGPPIWDVVFNYLKAAKTVAPQGNSHVSVIAP